MSELILLNAVANSQSSLKLLELKKMFVLGKLEGTGEQNRAGKKTTSTMVQTDRLADTVTLSHTNISTIGTLQCNYVGMTEVPRHPERR